MPIQQDKGGKWVQATISGTTFTADLTTLNELPNGSSDIKAAAFDSANKLVGLVRVPITITGSTVPVAPLNVTIQTPPLSSDLSMRITVLDEDWYQKNEDVVYASKVISHIGNLTFPTTIPLTSVKADSKCRVMVSVSQRVGNKDSILYTGLTKIKVEGGKNNNCTVELHRVQ